MQTMFTSQNFMTAFKPNVFTEKTVWKECEDYNLHRPYHRMAQADCVRCFLECRPYIHLSKFYDCFETKFCDVRVVWYFHLSQARIRSWRRGLDYWIIILCVRRDKDLNTHQELCQMFWYICDLTSCAYWQNIALPFLIKCNSLCDNRVGVDSKCLMIQPLHV